MDIFIECPYGMMSVELNSSVISAVSPRFKTIFSVSKLMSNGSDIDVSTTPILFSTHSVNQIFLSSTVKPNTWATPQYSIPSQSAQLVFLEGTVYSTIVSLIGSNTAIRFALCSFITNFSSNRSIQYGLDEYVGNFKLP